MRCWPNALRSAISSSLMRRQINSGVTIRPSVRAAWWWTHCQSWARQISAAVTGLNCQQRVVAHERHGHGHQLAIGKDHVAPVAELFDDGENVVPAAAVQTCGVVTQFPQDFVHFESRENGFNKDGGTDRT